MGWGRIRGPHRTRARGLACPQSPRPCAHPFPAFVTPCRLRDPRELLGHKDVRTTMIYTHVLNKGGLGVRSPVDAL